MIQTERSILNRLFDIREELEELVSRDDALYVLINCAISLALRRENQGDIPGEEAQENGV